MTLTHIIARLTFNRPRLIVYQMGKVASSSVHQAIKRDGRYRSYQTHVLNPDSLEKAITAARSRGEALQHHIRVSLTVRKLLGKARDDKHRLQGIVSLVREPVTRNISAFFQNLRIYHGSQTDFDVEYALDDFFDKYHHNIPLRWFDNELKTVFGIDVYASPFDFDRRCQNVEMNGIKCLVLRTEDDNEVRAAALGQAFDLDGLCIAFDNSARNKTYSQSYGAFLAAIRADDRLEGYIARLHTSPYSRHFYQPEELRRIVEKRLQPRQP